MAIIKLDPKYIIKIHHFSIKLFFFNKKFSIKVAKKIKMNVIIEKNFQLRKGLFNHLFLFLIFEISMFLKNDWF